MRLAIQTLSASAVLALAFGAQAQALPEGPGKKLVETRCGSCHGLDRVTRAGYSRDGWRNNLAMMENAGAEIPAAERIAIIDYLAAHFPEKPAPAAAIVPGSARIAIREWDVPTPGSRPHDPLATRDGMLWYTGQFSNRLGRLDPKTGQATEFALKTPGSGPHGLAEDRDGNIWFTANFKGYVGKLDPRSGTITEYPMPDAAARDPHTPVVDARGLVWFTVQNGNRVGRLDPKTGDVKLVTVPTPKARPYGILVNSKGVPFFVEFGANKVASIDPQTMAIREYELPDAKSRPRRIAITADDTIWYTDYSRGYLGRLDPATGKVTEWPSPSGPRSLPYGIVATRDAIWFSESGVKPNTIVRFDLRTQKFQSAAIPSGGGVVRHMTLAPDGRIAIACSGVNKVGLVE